MSVLFLLYFSLIFNEHRYGANESLKNYWAAQKKATISCHQTFRSLANL